MKMKLKVFDIYSGIEVQLILQPIHLLLNSYHLLLHFKFQIKECFFMQTTFSIPCRYKAAILFRKKVFNGLIQKLY